MPDVEPIDLSSDKPIIAAFDFDGTLTRRNTFVPFLYAISRSSLAFARHLMGSSLSCLIYSLGKKGAIVSRNR